MKTLIIYLALMLAVPLSAQILDFTSGSTYAVVVGISDYRDDRQSDLQFADRDAEIFADYLISKAGDKVPAENIRLLTNEKATLAAIDDALDWLRRETQKDDLAIIYFAGHGDVEKQTLWQLGYLLAHDTPFNNYRNNAIRIEDLNDLVTTLSVGVEARVIVILDACRSGKLAGSDNRGPSLTAEQLGKQIANEARIMSCKPNQESLESAEWGGGRGLFSYHFINGLIGMADEGEDLQVVLEEMEDYLKDNIRTALKNREGAVRQDPVLVGDELFRLSVVDNQTLEAAIAMVKNETSGPLAGLGQRGMTGEDLVGGESDPVNAFFTAFEIGQLAVHPDFQTVMEGDVDGFFPFFIAQLSSESIQRKLGDDKKKELQKFFELATNAAGDEKLRRNLNHRIAAKLHDRAQEVINLYLQGDVGELERRYFADQRKIYAQYPLMLKTALRLLPADHPLYHNLQVKYHYFNGVSIRLMSFFAGQQKTEVEAALEQQKMALKYDDKAAYVHNELGIIYTVKQELDKAKEHLEKAIDLVPSWAIAYSNLSYLQTLEGQLENAKKSAEKAISLQPGYFRAYANLGLVFAKENNYLKAASLYRKAMKLNHTHFLPPERLAYLLLKTAAYSKAEESFLVTEERKQGVFTSAAVPIQIEDYDPINLEGKVGSYSIDPDDSPTILEKLLADAKDYFQKGDDANAEKLFKEVIEVDPANVEAYDYLGRVSSRKNQFEKAELYFLKALTLASDAVTPKFFLAEVYEFQGRLDKAEALYRQLLYRLPDPALNAHQVYQRLSPLLEKQGRYLDQEKLLWEYADFSSKSGIPALSEFYLRMVAKFFQNADWLYKAGTFFYINADNRNIPDILEIEYAETARERINLESFGKDLLEKAISVDTGYSASAYLHNLVAKYYLNKGLSDNRHDFLENAITNFQRAIQLAPEQSTAQYGILEAYTKLMRHEEAKEVLDSMYRQGKIDFPYRLQHINFSILSGEYAKVETLVREAMEIQLEQTPGLYTLQGKMAMLRGQPDQAIELFQKELALDSRDIDRSALTYSIARLRARQDKKTEALDWLRRSLEKGFRYRRVIKYDADWDSLRTDERFNTMLREHQLE